MRVSPCAKRGEQQYAVRNALGSRQFDRAADAAGWAPDRGGPCHILRPDPSGPLGAALQQPLLARAARALEHAFQRHPRRRARSSRASASARPRSLRAPCSRRLPVRNADVAPHLGRAAGDAHGVAQTAGGETEQLPCIAPARQRVDQSVGHDVRQMAHRRENRIVLAGQSSRSTRAPQASHAERTSRTAPAAVSALRRQNHVPAAKRSANAAVAPLFSVPAMGWAGTKREKCAAR